MYKSKERVVFHLATPMKEGSIRLHVAFAVILNDYLQGFYRSKYIVDGEERYMATTQFESTDARPSASPPSATCRSCARTRSRRMS